MSPQPLKLLAPPETRPVRSVPRISPSTANAGYEAHDALQPLLRTLSGAVRFRDTCRCLEDREVRRLRKDQTPKLFSFDRSWQHRLDCLLPKPTSYLIRHAPTVTRQAPQDAEMWVRLASEIDRVFPTLLTSVEARRVARALPGLEEAAESLGNDHERAHDLTALLDVVDDVVFDVRHPDTGRRWRILVQGIEDNYHLQVLLVDQLWRELGVEPFDPKITAAYRGTPLAGTIPPGRAQLGMYTHSALRPDGTLPVGLAASNCWIWGERSPREIPLHEGERVILVGRPAYASEWDVERRFPTLRGEITILQAGETARLAA